MPGKRDMRRFISSMSCALVNPGRHSSCGFNAAEISILLKVDRVLPCSPLE